MNKRDEVIVAKLLGYCYEIEATHRFFQDDRVLFCDEQKGFVYRNSITMPILQIGELTKALSKEFRDLHKEIPWKDVAGTRDIFAHHYGEIDYDMVWTTSHENIEQLRDCLQKAE